MKILGDKWCKIGIIVEELDVGLLARVSEGLLTCEQLEENSSKLGYGEAQPITVVPLEIFVYKFLLGYSHERIKN